MQYGLYVHIPFCRSKCNYCDFYSSPCKSGVPEEYISAILRDFLLYAPKDDTGVPHRPYSVYIGGGTPSLLSAAQIHRILHAVFPADGAEVSMEVNPCCADAQKLRAFRLAGVNRISVGVQSASAESLVRLGRTHTPEDAARTFEHARRAGFENISGDIMLALPHYSNAEFDDTLRLLRDGGVGHVSVYLLKLESGTPMGDAPHPSLPSDDQTADYYLHACDVLVREGYAQYEISNFAKAGFECKHNLLYWQLGSWLGLGPAAHSCLLGERFSFEASTERFLSGTLSPQPQGTLCAEDLLMLCLRLTGGLDETELMRRFGTKLSSLQRDFFHKLCKESMAHKTPKGYALTPKGMLLQNEILSSLFMLG